MSKYIWQLPQNIVGAIIKKVLKAPPIKTITVNNQTVTIYAWKYTSAVSLGQYIFMHEYCAKTNRDHTIEHESGHSIQSMYLGWLYLLVIGLPSFIWANCFKDYRKKHNKSYYSFYTERWADKLANVERCRK